ncbi:MAG: DUF1707 domain-containing protein [Acidimicrobiales bacterium]
MSEFASPIEPSGGGLPIRASDAEREHAVQQLSVACAEGRLTLEELGVRVATAYSAVARGELELLLSDLPGASSPAAAPGSFPVGAPGGVVDVKRHRTRGKWIVSIMSEASRSGHWRMPSKASVVTIMGQTTLDLRNAVIESSEIEVKLFLMMGEQRVIVPEGVEVEVSGFVLMGAKKVNVAPVMPRPGVPRLHLRVIGMMGELRVNTGGSNYDHRQITG